jgi:glycosyltransferase involved in cell wall biosynthesis
MARPRVLIAQKSLPQYRVPFFDELRRRLAGDGIDLQLVHGLPTPRDAHRRDRGELRWALRRQNRVLSIGGLELVWQPCLADVRSADLVVVEQASRLLVNYVLLGRQAAGRGKVAFWGHGANLQPRTANASSEWLKRQLSRLPHWWFAYTEGGKDRVTSTGYPAERVTVVQNAQDTERLSAAVAAVTQGERDRFRAEHGLGEGPVGLFLGSLSKDKRVDFLLESCARIAAQAPGFRLLVAGDGEELPRVLDAAGSVAWLRTVGRIDGLHERAVLLSIADGLLMPGAVGLVVLDGFAAGVPLVATAVDSHGPEMEYVRNGTNGVIAPDPDDAAAYATCAFEAMTAEPLRERLLRGCREARQVFTLEAMVERFAGGIRAALEAR